MPSTVPSHAAVLHHLPRSVRDVLNAFPINVLARTVVHVLR